MKKLIYLVLLISFVSVSFIAAAIEESNLPQEENRFKAEVPSESVQGYANSKNIVMIGSVMGVTYNFCNEPKKKFCSDHEGILIISGSDTGTIPRIIKTLDKALQDKNKIVVKFSVKDHFLGVREIIDVRLVSKSI